VDDSVFAGSVPWNQWGNTQELVVPPNAFTMPNVNDRAITLVRAAYGRPETWRFLLAVKLIDAPATGPGDQANAQVWFELFSGIGRSAVHIPFWVTMPGWQWNGGAAVPRNVVDWTNVALTSTNTFSSDSSGPPPLTWTTQVASDQIVGQDITIVAHATFTTDIPGVTQPARIEVSGQISPNTHVRPDWMRVGAPPAEQFAGGEVKGR
jgi:hypothetical protein